MTKYIRPNCVWWCGTLSKPEWKEYRDLPSQKELGNIHHRVTYWKSEQSPYNGNIIQIWDSPACREFQCCANNVIKENIMKEVWYIWKVGGGIVMVSKENESAARTEAEHLCNIHGGEFIVCKAVASCKRNAIKWTNLDPDSVPF